MSQSPPPAAASSAFKAPAAAPDAIVASLRPPVLGCSPSVTSIWTAFPAEVDSTVTLDTVLLVNDGTTSTLGQPYVQGAKVELKVLADCRGTKVIVNKMRPKKKTRRKAGHRQELTNGPRAS